MKTQIMPQSRIHHRAETIRKLTDHGSAPALSIAISSRQS